MDLLQGKIKKIYFQYLGAAFGSALISANETLYRVVYWRDCPVCYRRHILRRYGHFLARLVCGRSYR